MKQNIQPLNKLIDAFGNNNILCIGDIMLDEYIIGTTERISPEAPVPVVRHIQTKRVLGGVGNVAANLQALGCNASVFCTVGSDNEGYKIEEMMRKKNVLPYLYTVSHPTTKKQRIIAQKQQVCRVDFEEQLQLTKPEENKIIYQIGQILPEHNVVILSDYNKGLLTPRITQAVIKMANKQKIPVLIDPKGHDYQKYQGATLIKPNLGELKTAIQTLRPDLPTLHFSKLDGSLNIPEIQFMANLLRQTLNIRQAVITLGEHGMIGTCNTNSQIYRPTAAQAVSDVSGAGDTSLALLATSLGAKAPLETAMDLANIAAGIVVAKEGTATLSKSELKSAVKTFFQKNRAPHSNPLQIR